MYGRIGGAGVRDGVVGVGQVVEVVGVDVDAAVPCEDGVVNGEIVENRLIAQRFVDGFSEEIGAVEDTGLSVREGDEHHPVVGRSCVHDLEFGRYLAYDHDSVEFVHAGPLP